MPDVGCCYFWRDPETLTPENATALTIDKNVLRQKLATAIDQEYGKKTNLHVDFVSRVSADHMENGKSTTRVFVEPSVQLEGVSFVDDNDVTFVN